MPGNEGGDRVHNFFQQGNFSPGHHQPQPLDENWSGFRSNLWRGNERQAGGLANSKNYNAPKQGGEGGEADQLAFGQYGLNFASPNPRPDSEKSQLQNQQLILNGFAGGSQALRTVQNDANGLGVDAERQRHNLMRGTPVPESQQRSGPQHNNLVSASFGSKESPGHFDFLGSQHQMSSQYPGTPHSLARQQSGMTDGQLIQQQVLLKQMQELQRQQQMQQLEAMQRNHMGAVHPFSNQGGGNHAPTFINGTPMHDPSSYPWISQVMNGNPNWVQQRASPSGQVYSNGLMISPEQGNQALRFLGVPPQQPSQSLYGVPVTGTQSGVVASQVGKAMMHQVPVQGNLSFSPNENPSHSKQRNLQEADILSRQSFEGSVSFGHASREDSGGVSNVDSFSQMQQQIPSKMDRRHEVAVSLAPSFPDQTAKGGGSSQEAVALDPAEEKILFGSDDNIWEAFGGSLTESTEVQNQSEAGFPSTLSGSWSALMQSAVAEASSSDEGKQGEWSGIGLQNSGSLSGRQQLPVFSDSRKQPPPWVDSSQMASHISRPLTSDSFLSSNHHKPGLQQPYLRQSKDTQQTRPGHQSSEETRKQFESSQPKMVAHGGTMNGLTYPSGDYSAKNSSSRWNHQQTIFSPADQHSRPGNYAQSETNNGAHALEKQATMQGNDIERGMNLNVGSSRGMTLLDSVPNSGLDMGRHQINSKGLLSNISANQTSENAYREFWRPGNSATRPVTNDSVRYQPHLERVTPQVLESPVRSFDRSSAEMHEVKSGNHRENSCDSHGSNISNHASSGGLRENVGPDAGDRHFPVSRENSIGPTNQITTPAPRRFQYHPMGEVDVDMNQSYGTKNMLPSNAMPHNFYGVLKSQEGPPRFGNAMTSNSAEREKASTQKQLRDVRASCGASSSGTSPGFTPTPCAPFDRSGGIPTSSNSSTSSDQNMLELLQKVDQSKEPPKLSRFGSSDLIKSSNVMEAADGSGAKQSSSSISSQGFGLQLAPPSQGLRAPHMMMASQNPSQAVSPDQRHVSDKGDKMQSWLSSGASSQPHGPHPSVYPSNQGESNFYKSAITGQINADTLRRNMQMNTSANYASESGDKSRLLQHQQITDSSTNNSHNVSLSQAEFGQPIRSDQPVVKVSMQQMAVTDSAAPFHPSATRGMYNKGELSSMIPNMWTNMMKQQQLLGTQSANSSNTLKTPFHPNSIPGTSGTNFHQNQFLKDVQKKVGVPNPQGSLGPEEQMLPGKQLVPTQRTHEESEAKDAKFTVVSRPDSGVVLKGIEAFGHTSRPSSGVADSYSLGHRAQSMKDIDPNNRQMKRFKGAEHGPNLQQSLGTLHQPFSAGSSNVDGNLSANRASGDAKILSFSPEPSNERENHLQRQVTLHKGLPVQGGLQKSSDNNTTPQISLQMAPTWFKQYGTLKNGQLLSLHGAQRAQAATNPGMDPKDIGSDCRPTVHQPNAVIDSDRMVNTWSTTHSYITSQQLSLHPLASGYATGTVDSVRPKKRKSAAADLLPWHKEVAEVSQRKLPNISMAEHEWARAAHRLFEKIEEDVNARGDLTPVRRARRRLVLTSQLMQQIFRPPPQSILTLDASTECETVTFFVARLALGDACSLVCQSDGNSSGSQEGGNQSGVLESGNRISYQYLAKVTEDFGSRAKVLENEFLRLDRRASFLDLRLESQELERFSVINRFARFHGRNQAEGAGEGSSASDQATAMQRVGPLRYVDAYPNPKNLPESAQCFTL